MIPLEHALHYAAKGWHVLPVHSIREGACSCGREDCPSPGKHPRTRRGVHDATTDTTVIESWWNTWPDANVAIATGSVSGVWSLDLDTGGEDTLNDLEEQHGKRPDTPEQHTGGGGLHILFTIAGLPKIPNKVRCGHGLDVRGDGGYIVAAPSNHASGGTYEWDALLGCDHPVADPPRWILELIGAVQTNGRAKKIKPPIDPTEILSGVPAGKRNDKLFRYACRLVNQGLTELEIRHLARQAARACSPPLPDGEVATLVESALKYQTSDEPPVPLDTPGCETVFPVEVLAVADPQLADYVRDIAEVRQVPVDMPALLVLTTLASITMRHVRLQIGPTHSVPTNLYLVISLPPGNRKSSSVKDATAPLLEIEQHLVQSTERDRIYALERYKGMVQRIKAAEKRLGNTKNDAQFDAALAEVTRLKEDLGEPPVPPRLMIGGDTSLEKLGMVLAEHGERLALFDDEGGIFEMLSGIYNNGVSNIDLVLKCWDGSPHRTDRVGRGSLHLKNPLMSVGICVQPSVIEALAERKAFRGRGLLGRFIYAMPRSTVGSRMYQERAPRADLQDAYHRLVREMWDEYSGEDKVTLKLRGDALAEWRTFHDRVELMQAKGERLEQISDWASKLASDAVGAVIAILHCVKHRGNEPHMHEIDRGTVLAAWAIGEYLIEHAVKAFGLMTADPDVQLAEKVLEWVKDEKLVSFSASALVRRFRGTGRNKQADFFGAIRVLEERGHVKRITTEQTVGRPRGPSFEVVG